MKTEEAREMGWGDRAEDFAAWKTQVDRELVKRLTLDSMSIRDFPYADYFESGYSPEDTAQEIAVTAVEEAGLEPWF